MVIRGCTLPGAMKGIKFYLQPEVSKLADITVRHYSLAFLIDNLRA